jgi:hypothetical protein
VLALALGGWWWIATQSLQRGILSWLEVRRSEGIETEIGNIARGGFPLRIAATVTAARFTDPALGATLSLPQVTLSTPVYWPGDAALSIDTAVATFTTLQGDYNLSADAAAAQIELHPGTSLQLETLAGSVLSVALDAGAGRVLNIDTLRADVTQNASPQTYAIALTATGLTPGSVLTNSLTVPPATLPQAFDPIVADMVATFDRPWDRAALNTTRPQLRALRIAALDVSYGDAGISVTADLNVDAQGVPMGTAQLKLHSWQQMFAIAMAATDAPPNWAPLVRGMLQSMSDAEGALELEITFAQGQMRAGFLPLGPAPRLIIP